MTEEESAFDEDFEEDVKEDFDDEVDAEADNAWYEQKIAMMEEVLGAEHDMVMHAIIPYALGGGLDLYYYPNGVAGTGVATKELSHSPGEGSSNNQFDTYELVMFTRHPLALDDAHREETPFGRAHHSINAILNCMAPYSEQATLNPCDTCEFPEEMEEIGGRCLILDAYGSGEEPASFGLMLVMEIHRSEMEFAREQGGAELIERLKIAGCYPYSDLDRPPVV